MLKASELLDRYIEDHGTIKKSVPLSAIMNKIQKRKEFHEMIQDPAKAYENFKKERLPTTFLASPKSLPT